MEWNKTKSHGGAGLLQSHTDKKDNLIKCGISYPDVFMLIRMYLCGYSLILEGEKSCGPKSVKLFVRIHRA